MDETVQNTRKIILIVLTALVAFFAVCIMAWYFFFKPQDAPTNQPNGNGLSFAGLKAPRFSFILNNNDEDVAPTSTSETSITKRQAQALVEIWKKPATGYTFVNSYTYNEVFGTTTPNKTKKNPNPTPIVTRVLQKSTSTTIMFVDRATGYIYGYNKDEDTTYQISNTQIPGVYDAYIFNDGQSVAMRYLDDDQKTIISIVADIPTVKEGDSALPLINVTNLPKNITSIARSSVSGDISFVSDDGNKASFYTLKENNTPQLIATSPYREWTTTYGGSKLFAYTKPSAYIEGQTVSLPTFTRYEGGRTGLASTISKNGQLFNSMWAEQGLTTFISNQGSMLVTKAKTLAKKCTWLNSSQVVLCGVPTSIPNDEEGLPDDWYQGRYFFSDTLSFVDTKTGDVYPLYSFKDPYPEMDIVSPLSSDTDKDIMFIRKQSGSLWLLKTDLIVND